MESTKFNLQKWQLKRSRTVKAFTCECVLLGMEYSVTFLTLWVYITTLVDTDHPTLFYSIISASYLLSAVIFSVIIGRWIDKTRNVRATFLICNTLVIVGNLIYTLHYSPWLLVFGRFLCGIGGPLRSVVSGEVSRCFPAEQVMSKFSTMGMAFSVGFIMGPGVNFIFKDIDVFLGSFHLTFANVCGFYMAGFFILVQIYILFAVSDLSKEYDLKANEIIQKESILSASHQLYFGRSDNPSNRKHSKVSLPLNNGRLELSVNSYINSVEGSFQSTTKPRDHTDNISIDSYRAVSCLDQSQTSNATNLLNSTALSLQRSLALDKIEQSGLFPQTFTRSDALLSVSVMLVNEMEMNFESRLPLLINKQSDEQTSSVASILRQIVTNFDVLFVFVLSFFMYFWMVAFDMWLPMMVVDELGMGITELNGIVFGFGCISALVLLLLSLKNFSGNALFKLSLFCVFSLAVMEVIFGSMKMYHTSLYVNIAMWVVWGTLFAIVVVIDEVYLIGVLAKMTSSKIQTFNESLRLSMTRFGALVALLTAAPLFEYVEYMCFAGVVFSFVVFFILVWRRKSLQDPCLVIR